MGLLDKQSEFSIQITKLKQQNCVSYGVNIKANYKLRGCNARKLIFHLNQASFKHNRPT